MSRADVSLIPSREIPQPPRFAVQRLVNGRWNTIVFSDPERPERIVALRYQTRWTAEQIAIAYRRTERAPIRVHEIGGAA